MHVPGLARTPQIQMNSSSPSCVQLKLATFLLVTTGTGDDFLYERTKTKTE